jgi:hypothetical protein
MRVKAIILILIIILTVSSLFSVQLTKNPYRAMLYSAIVPGGGQLYNHAYLKTFVVVGLQAYLVNSAIYNFDRKEHFRKLMDGSGSSEDLYNQGRRNHYNDNLKSDYWWMGTVLVLSVADAFVDAHLYNYKDERNKVRLKFEDKKLGMEFRL